MACPHAIPDVSVKPLLRLRAHPLRIALVGNPIAVGDTRLALGAGMAHTILVSEIGRNDP